MGRKKKKSIIKMETHTNMFQRPLGLSSPMKVSKWFWNNGKNKELMPEEQKQAESLSTISGFLKLLLKEEKTKPQEPTSLLKFLISKGLIKTFK